MKVKRADELLIGDIILAGPMNINKKNWKIFEIERIATRLFVKIEIQKESFIDNRFIDIDNKNEPVGDIWRIDCSPLSSFEVE